MINYNKIYSVGCTEYNTKLLYCIVLYSARISGTKYFSYLTFVNGLASCHNLLPHILHSNKHLSRFRKWNKNVKTDVATT